MKPQLSWLISLPHAMRMFKKMNIKKHRNAGYSFELSEVADQKRVWNQPKERFYADYKIGTPIFEFDIYYEKPEHETPVKKGKPDRGGSK